MNDISLSHAVRQNLLSLQTTTLLASKTQHRLATGMKVNSALDNPNSFFTAATLNSRSDDLAALLDSMGQGVQTLRAADEGIKAITTLVEAAKAKANQALHSSDNTEKIAYSVEFDALLDQIEDLADDAGYNGKNLLAGTANNLVITFNEDNTSKITITAVDYASANGLGIADAVDTSLGPDGKWTKDADVETALTAVATALSKLRSQASTFGTNMTVVNNRQQFTKSMMNTLEVGAGNLVLADTNEEGANLLALQTRQQLSSTALSMAAQADQNVLRLFG